MLAVSSPFSRFSALALNLAIVKSAKPPTDTTVPITRRKVSLVVKRRIESTTVDIWMSTLAEASEIGSAYRSTIVVANARRPPRSDTVPMTAQWP
jgi:hypothetical protein